jgi:diguanylate cyclase (GGDEF)-like protein
MRAAAVLLLWLLLGGWAAAAAPPASFVLRALPADGEASVPRELCDDSDGRSWRRSRIEAPVVGWDGRPLAVMVSGAGLDRVRLAQGGRVYCGQYGDGARMDSRFRSGVGGVFVPVPGSSEPVEIAISGVDFELWPAVVDYGPPPQVQQLDALRFALRIAVLAVALGIAASTAVAWLIVRDSSVLLFSLAILGMSVWIALATGLSGFPQAWLPVGELRGRLLITVPLLVAAGFVYLLLANGRRRRNAWLDRVATTACASVAAIGLSALAMPSDWLTRLALLGEVATVLLFVALLLLSLPGLVRSGSVAFGSLLAALPLAVLGLLGLVATRWVAPWKTELLVAAGAWAAMAASAMLLLRIGSLRQQRDAMRILAESDALTGLCNRRTALERLEAELLRSHADGGEFGLLYIDVDHFKQINDSFGHAAGDRVLVAVAGLLRQLVRASDTVARLGGEEFLLLLPGADPATTMRLGERIRARIEANPMAGSGPEAPLACTASVGVVHSSDFPLDSADELLKRADAAMYAAKRGGRNRVERAD